MAKSKEDIKYGVARTKVAGEDETLRVAYVHGTPLEGGKISDSQPVDLFSKPSADNSTTTGDNNQESQSQSHNTNTPSNPGDAGPDSTTRS